MKTKSNLRPLFICTLFLATGIAASAQNLVTNGDFENRNIGAEPIATFPNWSEFSSDTGMTANNAVGVAYDLVPISGLVSAQINKGVSGTPQLVQGVAADPLVFSIDLDFAILSGGVGTVRSFQMLTRPTARAVSGQINLIALGTGQLQVFEGSFMNAGSLTAGLTLDTGTIGVFDGETPVVNHLRIDADYDLLDGTPTPRYSLTLTAGAGGTSGTVTDLSFFQTADPASGLSELSFVGATSLNKSYLVDNVVVQAVPEPATVVSLLGGLGLLIAVARRRSRV